MDQKLEHVRGLAGRLERRERRLEVRLGLGVGLGVEPGPGRTGYAPTPKSSASSLESLIDALGPELGRHLSERRDGTILRLGLRLRGLEGVARPVIVSGVRYCPGATSETPPTGARLPQNGNSRVSGTPNWRSETSASKHAQNPWMWLTGVNRLHW
jgi:hypothetical protein